jgi:hypothetical protein
VSSSSRAPKQPREPESERERPAVDADYARAIARVEALPANQSGSDKSWVFEALCANQAHFARARRV